MHLVLLITSTVQQRPDRLNSIMAVWCVETPEVWANSSVYTPESLSQTKTNTFIGFQDLVCCDCPTTFEVSHRFMLFTYSCSFTMGYSVRRILAQCETKYEPSIRCVNCSQHTSYIQARCCYAGLNSERIFSLLFWFYNLVETYCWCSMCLVYWKSLTQAVAFAKLLWDLD